MNELAPADYQQLVQRISDVYTHGRSVAMQAVNVQLISTYWHVGQYIVEFEQRGYQRADYGAALITQLAHDLGILHGKGFSRSNLIRMRQLYLAYPKGATLSHLLSWSHFIELLKIDDPLERSFYEQQCVAEHWSVRELVRQKESALFLRLASSRNADGIRQLATQGQVVETASDLLREPYVFEFLKIPEPWQVSETQLETLLCNHLQQFLLELGKGFTFVGRQYRITISNRHYYVDLVFYHRILRCFVLLDLKINELQHQDIGQMNMYLGYFAIDEHLEGENPPIGLILTRHKDELLVEYATYQMNSQMFIQKYQLYLPNREELRRELEQTLRAATAELAPADEHDNTAR